MFLLLIIIIIVAIVFKHSYDLFQFNLNAKIDHIQNPNPHIIQDKIKEKSPIIIHNISNEDKMFENFTFEKLIIDNPGYIINHNNKFISLDTFNDKKSQLAIHMNQNLVQDFNIKKSLNDIFTTFNNAMVCNQQCYLSLYKGNNTITVTQNKNYGLILIQIYNNSTLYLIHPKHKNDITNKDNQEIKKWAYKINLKPNIVVHIPSQWFYFYESNESSILSTITYDTLFTFPFNSINSQFLL